MGRGKQKFTKMKNNKINTEIMESFLNEEMEDVKGGAAGGPVCHCDSGAASVVVVEPDEPGGPIYV